MAYPKMIRLLPLGNNTIMPNVIIITRHLKITVIFHAQSNFNCGCIAHKDN